MRMLFLTAGIAALGLAAPAHANPEAAMAKAGCTACHLKDKKLVGPSYRDIAAKYKGQNDAVPKLMDKVRKGGAGVFGPVPMAPNPPDKINDADLKAAVDFILKS
jgi:cytochrome c